jgi:hypothetical protein
MKRSISFLLTFISLQLISQNITFSDDLNKDDISDAFTALGLKNFKYEMPKEFKGYYFDFIVKEYFEGKEISFSQQSVRYATMKKVLQWPAPASKYTLKVQTLRNDTIETFNIRLPGISLRNVPLKLKAKRNAYGWQSLIDDKVKLTADTEIPFLAFSSGPTNPERQNVVVYCELPDSNYMDWYDKLKVQHFFVFIVKVTKTL